MTRTPVTRHYHLEVVGDHLEKFISQLEDLVVVLTRQLSPTCPQIGYDRVCDTLDTLRGLPEQSSAQQ